MWSRRAIFGKNIRFDELTSVLDGKKVCKMPIANIKTVKKCAFCKHWYDPTNSAISPRSPHINLWEYDDKCKKKCLKKNYDMAASSFCGKYECKLEAN